MNVGAATFTVSSTGSCGEAVVGNSTGSLSTIATLYDVQHASDTLLMNISEEKARAMSAEFNLLQGQNNLLQGQMLSQSSIWNETTRAMSVENSLMAAAASVATIASTALAGLSSAMTAIATLTTSISTLTANWAQTNISLAQAQATVSTLTQLIVTQASEGMCSNSSGFTSGPMCEPGFSVVSRTVSSCGGSSKYPATLQCDAVPCPLNSNGVNVPTGCTCNTGFSGYVVATTGSPFYTSSCLFTNCPNTSFGESVHIGCTCNAGTNGSVVPWDRAPFFNSSCKPVGCPDLSTGVNVVEGCICNAGCSGAVKATSVAPFYNNLCLPIVCPAFSTGVNVVEGCICNAGYNGSIIPTRISPFYSSSCAPIVCPANSIGTNVVAGCQCNLPYFGFINATSPYFCPFNFGSGADGPLSLTTGSNVDPCFYLTSGAAQGTSTIQLNGCAGIVVGSELLLHQTQSQSTPGRNAFVFVTRNQGCLLTLASPLAFGFSSGAFGGTAPEVTQVAIVRQYTTVSITGATKTSTAWNGQCGGIVAFRASNSVTVSNTGSLTVSGKGFRGAPFFPSGADYSNGYNGESEKIGYQAQRSSSAFGSSGGSGNGQGGGYGGAYATVGSTPQRGGCDNLAPTAPSIVGSNLMWDALFFGGSGSASGSHAGGGRDGAAGGASGGIIYIASRNGITNNGDVSSIGAAGQNGYTSSQAMGGGGGGAGGTIWLLTTVVNGSGTSVVIGGAGGTQSSGSCGPGGSGGSGGSGRSVSSLIIMP